MKLIISGLLVVVGALCISCGSDEPPPRQTVIHETRYVPVKPRPSGPEAFEPVNRY